MKCPECSTDMFLWDEKEISEHTSSGRCMEKQLDLANDEIERLRIFILEGTCNFYGCPCGSCEKCRQVKMIEESMKEKRR